jgi:hypothetical protein
MTGTERQRRWREGKRLAQEPRPTPEGWPNVIRPEPKPAPEPPRKPDPVVIRPALAGAGDHGQYAGIIGEVLRFVDGLPQPQVALFEVIQRLQREYRQRQ